jgi:ribonuclease T2
MQDRAEGQAALVLHGLWPDWDVNGDGKRNRATTSASPATASAQAMIALDAGNWLKLPPVKLSEASSNDLATGDAGHRGGSTGMNGGSTAPARRSTPEDYFATAIVLLREVERGSSRPLLADAAGGTLDRNQMLDAFETDFGPRQRPRPHARCSQRDGARRCRRSAFA